MSKPSATIYVRTEDEALAAKKQHPRALVYVLPEDLFDRFLLVCRTAEIEKVARRGKAGGSVPSMTKERFEKAVASLRTLTEAEHVLGPLTAADVDWLRRELKSVKLNNGS